MTSDADYRRAPCSSDVLTILRTLLATPTDFVSGTALAEQLGVSRPAIHGKLEKLRKQGFVIEAIRNRGYRVTEVPEVLHPDLLAYLIEQTGSQMEALYFPVIDSTNSEAERQLSHRRRSPFAIASSCQTKGRGRLGRNWHSATADNLYLSVAFQPNIPPQALQHFTLWAGIHICRALQSFVPEVPLQVKWPNDLLCKGRKFAGMLTEAKMDADSLRSIIFGIGLNVNSNPTQYPPPIRKTATSLYAVSGKELSLNQVAAQVTTAIQRAYDSCLCANPSEKLTEAWTPLDALAGQTVTARMQEREITGNACGIDETGALQLRTDDGTCHSMRAGDVTLKNNPVL